MVLQDLSFNATDNPTRMRTYAQLWDNQIKQKSPGAMTYLFAHWERQDRVGSQPIIDTLYSSVGAQLDATVVPAGDTWAKVNAGRLDDVSAESAHIACGRQSAPRRQQWRQRPL